MNRILFLLALGLASITACRPNEQESTPCSNNSQCSGTSTCEEGACVQQVPVTCAELGCPTGTQCVADVCVEPAPTANDCDSFQWMTTSRWFCNYTEGEPLPEPWVCNLNTTDGVAGDGTCSIQCEGQFWLPTQEFVIDAESSPPSLKTSYYGREFTCTQYVYVPPPAACGLVVQVPSSLTVFPPPNGNANLLWFDFVKVGPDSADCSPEITRVEILEMDNAFGFVPNPKMQMLVNNSFVTVPLSDFGEATSLSPSWSKTYYQWDGVTPVSRKTTVVFNCEGNCGSPAMPPNTVISTKLLQYWWRPNPTGTTVAGRAGAEHVNYFVP